MSERRDGPARGKDRGRPQRANIGREIAKRKRAEREERLELQRRAVRFRLVVAVVVLVAVIGGGLALYRSQAFAVRKLRVSGTSHLTMARVVALARVPGDTTLLRLPSAEIAQRLEKEPWIAEAKVRRVFPDTVQIDVVERRPVAAVDARQELWLVDAQRYVVEKGAADASLTVPVIRDVEGFKPKAGEQSPSATLGNALAVISGVSPEMRKMVRAVTAPSVDETALLTNEGIEILVGPARELQKKDAIARRILAEQRGKVVFIDVRNTSSPVSRGL